MALKDIIAGRLKKRKALSDSGAQPYPVHVKRTHTVAKFLEGFDDLEKSAERVAVGGRLLSVREHGGVTFGDLRESSGRVQLLFRTDALGEAQYDELQKFVDVGDFLSVEGKALKTKRGEPSIEVSHFHIIAKAVRPLPEKWHGLKDVEERYRRRYLDLLMNDEVRALFEKRSRAVKEIRAFLGEAGFVEVETPILQAVAGGASAKPFTTHLNAFDMDMFLRIAPELYLKRLLVGGFDKVYELGRDFRNEGVDRSHNPEFTMLEFYAAYWDYKEGMKFIEQLIGRLAKAVIGSTTYEYQGTKIDFAQPWERIGFSELLQRYAEVDYDDFNFEGLLKKAEELGVTIEKNVYSKAQVADAIYKKFCLPKIEQPTFVIHHPAEMLPLAKPLEDNPEYAASFQLIIAGWELAKGYSELNDPVVQREFFEKQEELRKKGNAEAQPMDEDFLEALEYGMPPAFGVGMGVDRIAAFLSGAHALREIILFPTMRPVGGRELSRAGSSAKQRAPTSNGTRPKE